MAKLEMVVGDWKGTGWQMGRGGEKVPFGSHETIMKKAGGTLFAIQGKHWLVDDPSRVIYDAFGTITYDVERKTYVLTNHFSTGATVVYDATAVSNGFRWKASPTIEMELLIVDGEWVEKGFRIGGDTKEQIFEITMKKSDD